MTDEQKSGTPPTVHFAAIVIVWSGVAATHLPCRKGGRKYRLVDWNPASPMDPPL